MSGAALTLFATRVHVGSLADGKGWADLNAGLEAADAYFRRSGRQVTVEYVPVGGVNGRAEAARALGRLLANRQRPANLRPHNPVDGLPSGGPPAE